LASSAPTERAREVLEQRGVATPPVPVQAIAEQLNLKVVYERLPHDTSSVLIREPTGRQVIGINALHAATRQRFSLAHEIAHALLHFPQGPPDEGEAVVDRPLKVIFRDKSAGQGTDRVEIDANTFAATLLMPEDMVRTQLRRRWEQDLSRPVDLVVADLAAEFDVSVQAMQFRLVNLGLADPA
jgi:Zn-dependent peptidase ImmA (M78 family)